MNDGVEPTVLVATDLGDSGEHAIRAGVHWALAARSQLVVMHCVPIQAPVAPLFVERGLEQQEAIGALERWAAEKMAAQIADVLGSAPESVRQVLSFGTPDVEIVHAAVAARAQLVIVGASTDRPPGHIAERVARLAPCDVLVARAVRRRERVLVASDLSPMADRAVARAAEVTAQWGARLTAMTVVDTAAPFPLAPLPGSTEVTSPAVLRESAAEHLARQLTGHGSPAEIRVVDGTVLEAIVSMAAEVDADLVVVGTAGRTGLGRMVLGNTAERVLREVRCSVLAVRGQGETG